MSEKLSSRESLDKESYSDSNFSILSTFATLPLFTFLYHFAILQNSGSPGTRKAV